MSSLLLHDAPNRALAWLACLTLLTLYFVGCDSHSGEVGIAPTPTGVSGSQAMGGGDSGGMGAASGRGGSGGTSLPYDGGTQDGGTLLGDPKTCPEAEQYKTYIGCDYWPTTVANAVPQIFDFTVVVSNPGETQADISVSGGALTTPEMHSVAPGQLVKIYLPWVSELKGPDTDSMTSAVMLIDSVRKDRGAYHLVASVPVLVYQFSPLEYTSKGGKPGKDWTGCPMPLGSGGCYSFSNDASLLLPSTAMTGNYRVVSFHGNDSFTRIIMLPGYQGYFAITATQDDTTVKLQISDTGEVLAGTGIDAMAPGAITMLTMNAGDVVQLVSKNASASDLTGSLVQADKPVQVIGGSPCIDNPEGTEACDHLEESVLPAETWGRKYVVTIPTGPAGDPAPASVRFVGNMDGTQLSYAPSMPSGAPTTLDAGQVVEIRSNSVDFIVTGDHEFAVSTVQHGGMAVGQGTEAGDPSLSAMTAVEQYRTKYVFLAPDDYDTSFADVVAPPNATLILDFMPVTATATPINDEYVVYRIALGSGNDGGHTLEADQGFGLQVVGYGKNTSYQYPGGLNLRLIAPAPPPIIVP